MEESYRRRPKLVISASGTANHPSINVQYRRSRQDDFLGTFLRVAKNCLNLPPVIKGISVEEGGVRGGSSGMGDERVFSSGGSSCRCERRESTLSSSRWHSSRSPVGPTEGKRGRRRHPATIQTPGRRIPTEEESVMEPLTNLLLHHSSPFDYPEISSREEELMILGEMEFREEDDDDDEEVEEREKEEEKGLLQIKLPPSTAPRLRTFSDATNAVIEDNVYQQPQNKLSNSLNGDIPVLTLYS